MEELQSELGLTYLFIAHNLSVVKHISDRVGVMYLGKMMEVAPSEELYANPVHPYTTGLLGAIPIPDPKVERARTHTVLEGDVPSPVNPPMGCVFHPRCYRAQPICGQAVPPMEDHGDTHEAACFYPLDARRPESRCYTRDVAQAVAWRRLRTRSSRKVRTPQSRVLDNVQQGKPSGKCHRNDTARRREHPHGCNGEMVR